MAHGVGEIFDGRYTLKRLVAQSQRGVAYEARHVHLDRVVLVRLLGDRSARREEARAALMTEASMLDRVRHPSVVRVVDAAESREGEPYLVTELLGGRPLDGVIGVRGALSIEESIAVARAIAGGLGCAHDLGMTHGAFGSSSVMLLDKPEPTPAKLLDVGVSPWPTSSLSGALAAMAYAAPERLAGEPPDPLHDVYSLGVLLFEMLSGQLPARDADATSALRDTPAPVVQVVRSALAPRATRYPCMRDLVDALVASTQAVPAGSLPSPSRRKHARAGYVTPVRVRRASGETIDGRSEDLSESGMLLLANFASEPNEEVLVRFALPSSGRMVSLSGEIRWARATRAGIHAIGVHFSDPGEKNLEDIRAYVHFMARE